MRGNRRIFIRGIFTSFSRFISFRKVKFLLRVSAILLFILFLPAARVSADDSVPSAASPVTVRAAYFYNGDFMHKDDDGSYAGYDIEYYYTIAGYAGWNIEFVEYDNLKDALSALSSGDADIMSGLSRTDEREASYLISANKMCTTNIAVQVRADDDRFSAGDTSAMTDLTCGILKGSNVVTLYTNWCSENGLTPHIVEYDSLKERDAAFRNGEVDAVAAGSTIEGAQKIAQFPGLDLFFMMNKNRGDLKSSLDRAMSILALENPNYASNLFERNFPLTKNTTPSFSASEKEFIRSHPSLRVALLNNDAPFSSVGRDGSVTGILPSYFRHLAEVIGFDAEFVTYDSKDELFRALADGSADIVGKDEDDIFDANTRHVLLSDVYLEMNMVQITRAGTSAVGNAAVPDCNSSWVKEKREAMGSTFDLVCCANSEEAFAQLKSGNADSVICTQPAATWLLARNRSSDYSVSAFASGSFSVACALPSGSSGNILRSVINKTVMADGSYIQQLITAATLQDSADFASIFDRMTISQITAVAIVFAVLLAMAAAALVILIRRRKIEKRLALQQAELTAERETNKARHAFFGTISHDMRTPLNGILGYTDLALKSSDSSRVHDCLLKIRTSGNVLNDLVSDTLIMSRIESGKYILHPAACQPDDILTGILDSVREMASEKDVDFIEKIPGSCRQTVMADRLSLQKVFLNLLSNAVKFTPAGGAVTFSCMSVLSGKASMDYDVTVSDTGIGISPEFLPHVFEPFSQENRHDADRGGSGMGLSIVRNIMDAMGGTVDAKSDLGKGSAFHLHFRLPLAEESAAECSSQASALPEDTLKGRKVLVCEDNALNMEIIRSILERSGMAVIGAENGRAGLEAFEKSGEGEISIIFLDLRMPVMNGIETAMAIRALNRSDASSVLIYAVSADAYPENIAECLNAGMNGHISKPLDPEKLLQTAAEALNRKES